ncbi:phage tail protein [uncultured Clostridium sp.]|uniref:phage tail protein n=1 Tax=uncultured Clostridium sp. TaxID=59620 RepID=UPI0028E313B2|nr:phage tail protein [uncultured Clostridium sp.]
MAEKFYTILTSIGKSKLANSTVLGNKINLKTLQVGDGNGTYHEPSEDQTSLINKVWIGEISSISTDESNSNWIIIQTIIPATDGGFYIREAGIFDEEGDLIAVSKVSETYKPVISEGSAKDVSVKIVLEVSNADNVTLKIDPNIVVATKNDIEVLELEIQDINTNISDMEKRKANQSDLDITNANLTTKADENDNSRTTTSKTVTGAINELNNNKASLSSPAFIGIPTAPTPATTISNTQIATTAFVKSLLGSLTTNIYFPNSGTDFRGVQGVMADNDCWRIGGAGTASDNGYLEIATCDNGTEPIYIRQYIGTCSDSLSGFDTVQRTLTLLDANGNTSIPGNLIIDGNNAISSVSGGYKIQSGQINMALTSNGTSTTIINFPNSFNSTPLMFFSMSDCGYGYITNTTGISGWGNSGTSATVNLKNNSTKTATITVNWLAIGN